jgi:hypothetical protein
MRTIFHFTAFITLVFIVLSCKKESSDSLANQDFVAQNYSFLKSTQASNEANLMRSNTYSAPFEITKVDRKNNILNITVNYPDDCGDTRFEVIWNGLALESYPEIIFFYLRRTSDCKTAEKPASRVLSVNLAEKLGDAALAQRVKVILCNTSKKANTDNSDISVSSN